MILIMLHGNETDDEIGNSEGCRRWLLLCLTITLSYLLAVFFFFLIKKNRKETEEHQELILRSPLSSHLPSPPYLPIHLLSPPPPLP